MDVPSGLLERYHGKCELCGSEDNLSAYEVPPFEDQNLEHLVLTCGACRSQLDSSVFDAKHWHCLKESMWSEVPGVRVLAYRILHQIKSEGWPQGFLELLYLEDDVLQWAQATGNHKTEEQIDLPKDSNGNSLENGDQVVIIKDLNVKGANFTAKRGTVVKNIVLVADHPEYIEGKINGQQIVILTKFVKKS